MTLAAAEPSHEIDVATHLLQLAAVAFCGFPIPLIVMLPFFPVDNLAVKLAGRMLPLNFFRDFRKNGYKPAKFRSHSAANENGGISEGLGSRKSLHSSKSPSTSNSTSA